MPQVFVEVDVPEQTSIGQTGIQTAPNEFSLPMSALVKAQNCVISGPGIVTQRRGQVAYGYTHTDGTENAGFFFGGSLFVHAGTTLVTRATGSGWQTILPARTPPDAALLSMRGAVERDNLYLTSTDGVIAIEGVSSIDTVSRPAGVLNGPIRVTSVVSGTNGGYLAVSSSVAYRIVYGVKDSHGTVRLGTPGARIIVTNTDASNTHNVTLTFAAYNELDVLVNDQRFWQMYRSKTVASSSTASDDLFLVAEGYFTAAEIAANEASFTDSTPEAFLQKPLYTNPNGGSGLAYGNARPPLAKDIASWANVLWAANTKRQQATILSLIGVGSGVDGKTGLRLGDQIRIVDTANDFNYIYTAWGSNDTGNRRFAITSSGSASANVRATSQSLGAMVERDNELRVEYLSSSSDSEGQLVIYRTALGESRFRLFSSTYRFPLAIGALVRTAGNTVTGTTANDHGLAVGDTIYVSPTGVADANFAEGTKTVATVGSSVTFTYTEAGVNVASATEYQERRITPLSQYAWNPPPNLYTIAAGSLVRTGGSTVTGTTTQPHGFVAGEYVYVQAYAAVDANFAEGLKLLASVPTATTFTYSEAGSNTSSAGVYDVGGQIVSDPNEQTNRLYFSNEGEPEAFPLPQYMSIGRPGNVIKRIVPLNDTLTVWTSGGLYAVSGFFPKFRQDLLDPTAVIVAPDTAAAVDGHVYALCTKGVLRTDGIGKPEIVSQAIESEVDMYLSNSMFSTTQVDSWGAGRETHRQYLFSLPPNSGAPSPYSTRRIYVYSTRYGGWTTWETARTWGAVNPSNDELYLGLLSSNTYAVESNTGDRDMFADGTVTTTASAYNSTTKTATVTSTSGMAVGDAVIFGAGPLYAVITSLTATTITLSADIGVGAGAVTAYTSYPIDVEWRTLVAPSPADWKHWSDAHIHFRLKDFYKATLGFRTDMYATQEEESSPLTTADYSISGSADSWVVGVPSAPKMIRVGLPTNAQRAAYLRVAFEIREAFSLWAINGLTLTYERGSERNQR